MYGSGVRTIGAMIIIVRMIQASAFCVAVVGTLMRGTCVCRIAATAAPTIGTSAAACGSPSKLTAKVLS